VRAIGQAPQPPAPPVELHHGVRGDRLWDAIAVQAQLDPGELADDQAQPGLVTDQQHVARAIVGGVQAADPFDDVARPVRHLEHRLSVGRALHRIGQPAAEAIRIVALDLALGASLPGAVVDLVEPAVDDRHLAQRRGERRRGLHRAAARADVDRAPERPARMARPPPRERLGHAVAFTSQLGVEHAAEAILPAALGLAVPE